MAQTITLTQSAYKDLIARIERVEATLAKIFDTSKEPKYGTDAWFEWAHKEGVKAIERGEFTRLKTNKDIDDFFKNL